MLLDFIQEQVYSFPLDPESFHVAHPVDVDAFLLNPLICVCDRGWILICFTLRHHIPSVNFMVVLQLQLPL